LSLLAASARGVLFVLIIEVAIFIAIVSHIHNRSPLFGSLKCE
jgi:hypothetical protein